MMSELTKKITIICLINWFLIMVLGLEHSFLKQQDNMYYLDIVGYTNQLRTLTYGTTFNNLIPTLNWSDTINSLKSVGNIIIMIPNLIMLPLRIIGLILTTTLAIIGVDINAGWWLSELTKAINNFPMIQYMTY